MAKKKIVEEKKIIEDKKPEKSFNEMSIGFNNGAIGNIRITKDGYIKGSIFIEGKTYMFISELKEA